MFRRNNKSKNTQQLGSFKKYSGNGKTYSNPFFEAKKNTAARVDFKLGKPGKINIFFIFVIILFPILFWFFLYSSYFTIKSIEARGENRLNPQDLELLAWSQINDSDFILWQQKNIFIFNKKELIQTLNLKYSFDDIIITKKLPSKIIIAYKEKQHSFLWLEKGIYYYIDKKGYVVERVGDKLPETNYPLITNNSNSLIDANKVSVNLNLIDYTSIFIEKMKDTSNIPIDQFLIDENSNTLKIKIKDGPKLFFDISGDIEKQLYKINALRNDILKDDFNKKEYIDVRVGDRVYSQ